jgi:outer membrane protein OmpA-like peptidoglycan-associated protein
MKMRRLVQSLAIGALGVLAMEGVSSAQARDGFLVNRFEPAERGSDWFTLDSLDLRGQLRPALGMTLQYNHAALVTRDANGDALAQVVQNQVIAHLGGSVNLGNRFRLGFDLPILAYGNGEAGRDATRAYPAPEHPVAFGDLRFGVTMRIFGQYGDPFTMALVGQFALPTGGQQSYMSDNHPRFMPHLDFAGDVGALAWAARVGYQSRDLSAGNTWDGISIGPEVNAAVAVGARLADRKILIGPEFFASTGVGNSDAFFSKRMTAAEVLLGFHWLNEDSGVRLGAGVGTAIMTPALGAPDVRVLLSFEWKPKYVEEKPAEPPKVADKDGDGVEDKDDACPTVAGVKDPDPKKNGCPVVKPKDKDGDGIVDDEDACPEVAGVKNDDPKKNGCPSDRDSDGIADIDDACVEVAGVKNDDPKKNGCPPDQDNDGIADADDACPTKPGVKSAVAKFNGCPADMDNDTVANEQDACPEEPGKPDADPEKNGCPKAFVANGEIKITDQVKFKTGSADIQPGKDSEEVLQAVLTIIKAHPEIKQLRVEGHTDNQGTPAINKKLSADRAASVVKWLVAHGVDKARLTSAGFGQDKPLRDNSTEDGRRHNRRVEFHIEGAAATTTPATTNPPPPATTAKPPVAPPPPATTAKPPVAPPPPATTAKPAPPPAPSAKPSH